MRILLVNYRYFISGGPEKYMFNIKKMLEDNGHEVIPFSIHSNKNVETEYSKYFVEPIGSRDATYFEECKKTPKVIWQMLTRSIYSTEVEKAIKIYHPLCKQAFTERDLRCKEDGCSGSAATVRLLFTVPEI